jgi:hypothetical protein
MIYESNIFLWVDLLSSDLILQLIFAGKGGLQPVRGILRNENLHHQTDCEIKPNGATYTAPSSWNLF